MKTKKTNAAPALVNNELNTTPSFLLALVLTLLLGALFIGVTSRVDTGLDYAMLTQQSYGIHFG
jgi:hypothetical protein